ncbi:hypothetical protein SAMN04487965_0953 [Microbulbifer donghaiensis]|uniref:Neutral/alkaline non-lysosomal ceramidase, N-terminal n=1 Tax=Microbulbifer donghaiensis TaxID=494016 RepID=A0A1M4XFJ6_9GAMM|nr:hypothetical protein [Microbulbifer donghaiensis]SHE92181.1 hypothetical protein SAMN04487965_0953 [Microbulbifer donghaiensis]
MPLRLLFLLTTLCLAASAFSADFRAGFAEVEITPQPGDTLSLLGGGSGAVESIGDPLYIQAAVLADGRHKIALVSADLLVLREADFIAVRQQLQQRGFDHVLIAATHTHGGYFPDPMLDAVRAKLIHSVETAGSRLQPVTIGATEIAIDEAYNRRIIANERVEMLWSNPDRIPNRDVDNTLGVIHLRDKGKRPFLTIFNYSAHPVVTMDLERAVVSADYPGSLRASFEQNVGGRAMFFLGAAGDVNPYRADTKPFAAAQAEARRLGQALSRGAARAIQALDQFSSEGHFRFDTLQFDDPAAEVGLLLLTPRIALASFPGEYFDALGKRLKRDSPVEFTFFVGMSNGDIRYVPTAADALLGGYGAEKPSSVVSGNTGELQIQAAIDGLKTLSRPPGSE